MTSTNTDHVDSHYARTATAGAPWPALSDSVTADVCVVGGGLAGLNTALGLAERGCAVVLLEARRIAWGASGRNGGFVLPGFSVDGETLAARLGRDHARRLHALSRDAVALIRHRIAAHAIACGPVIDGHLRVSRRDRPGALERRRDRLAALYNMALDYWPREKVRATLDSPRYFDALHDGAGFHLHPLNYSLGIAKAAAAAGVRLFEESAVRALTRDGAAHVVVTERGRVRADAVVLACGGYIDGLVPRLAGATVPVATAIVVTEPLGARLHAAIRSDSAIHDIRRTGNYYRILADGRLLWGGGMTAWTRRAPRRLAARMLGDLVATYPQFAGVRAETAWSGLMAYARHQMPQIGLLRPGLWYATGFGGHGMNTTTMAGELVALAIAERDDRYRLFAPFGLTRTFGPLGAAAAQATYWYYGFRDAYL